MSSIVQRISENPGLASPRLTAKYSCPAQRVAHLRKNLAKSRIALKLASGMVRRPPAWGDITMRFVGRGRSPATVGRPSKKLRGTNDLSTEASPVRQPH